MAMGSRAAWQARATTEQSRADVPHRPAELRTPYGTVRAHVHRPPTARTGVIFVGGVGNDVDGPCGAYVRLAEALQTHGVLSLRVSYRRVSDLMPCIEDVLGALCWLRERAVTRVSLVGWSFGGAVVISAGAASGDVVGVATLATQGYGAHDVTALGPRSLLMIHGTADPVLPYVVSERLHEAAHPPKRLLLLDGAGHDLVPALEQAEQELLKWLLDLLVLGRR